LRTLARLRAGQLSGITRLDLTCGLSEFPKEIFGLADSLEILNLSGNALCTLPDELPKLRNLRVIFCSNNRFTELPKVLGQCDNLEMVGFKANQIHTVCAESLPVKLRWLILTDNRVCQLPNELGACSRLQKLMLAGNQLQALPDQMAACQQLELVRLSANQFARLPDWLTTLPRLAWLAFAGNSCSDAGEIASVLQQPITHIDWSDIELGQPLGEGASGVIYHAKHKVTDSEAPVAVKMFKGALTSDGLPRSEKAACIAAGYHPGLISVAGKIMGHPENVPGLVMSLIDPSFVSLAAPPSLQSCTRDIYPVGVRFSLPMVLNIAFGVATVVAHLHSRGIMHGDLYAHNILKNEKGECLLADFGAATFLPHQDKRLSAALQRIEVRAFSCLLEELLERCEVQIETQNIVDALRALQLQCSQPEANARPLFAEIQSALSSIAAPTKWAFT
jgi:hypothetical protein